MRQKTIGTLILVLGLALVAGCSWRPESRSKVPIITTTETQKLLESSHSVVLLDVRTPEEWKSSTGHLPNAVLIPLQELEARFDDLESFQDRMIITYCRSGIRSQTAARLLIEMGFKALSMEGGILKWIAENRSVIKETNQ
ncbi:MAG: rhodanese-like domain-containing protein [Ignavibacteria bacterium]|nr:rhodanese-like domain-containing protein [Ignavibacteria bacterium]